MKKILVMGNSHAGAIKSAEKQSLDHHSKFVFEYACYAARALDSSFIKGEKFILRNWDEKKTFEEVSLEEDGSIILGKYDFIVLVGGVSPLAINHYLNHQNVLSPLSNELINSIITYGVIKTIEPLEKLSSILKSNKVIYIGQPLPARGNQIIYNENVLLHLSQLGKRIRSICKKTWNSLDTPSLVFPSEEVYESDLFAVKPEFVRAGLRFDGRPRKKSDSDYNVLNHGNYYYGESLFKELCKCIENN